MALKITTKFLLPAIIEPVYYDILQKFSMLNSYEAVEHILASVVRQDGSLILCCMFVTDMEEGYLQLKNEDVTESDFFGVKTNHSSVVAQKILHFFCCLVL